MEYDVKVTYQLEETIQKNHNPDRQNITSEM